MVSLWARVGLARKVCMHNCVLILCDSMHCSPSGSSVHRILQEEYWSGLPFLPPEDLPGPGIKPTSPALAGWATWEALNWHTGPRKSQSDLPLGSSGPPWWWTPRKSIMSLLKLSVKTCTVVSEPCQEHLGFISHCIPNSFLVFKRSTLCKAKEGPHPCQCPHRNPWSLWICSITGLLETELCPHPESHLEVLNPRTSEWDLTWNRVFADVIS